MDEQEKSEAGSAVLGAIDSTRARSRSRLDPIIEGATVEVFAPEEQAFFERLDNLRGSDPAAFEALSAGTKASYGTWK